MLLKGDELANRLSADRKAEDRLVITPEPDEAMLRQSGAASIDLRLGCWFAALRHSRAEILDVLKGENDPAQGEHALTKMHYVPFGSRFVLQPHGFVLGVTLEWIRIPPNLGGYVTARSRIGRRGLNIATATGVHPGFTGCLTLELSNSGVIPIALRPGLSTCQLFLHKVEGTQEEAESSFIGHRLPLLGAVELDEVALALSDDG
jgi:dCTP deaminase